MGLDIVGDKHLTDYLDVHLMLAELFCAGFVLFGVGGLWVEVVGCEV